MMKKFLTDENAQAVVEYILLLSVLLGTVGIMAAGFKKTLKVLWVYIVQQTSAACPTGCSPPSNVR